MSITALIGSGLKFHALSKRTHRTAPQPPLHKSRNVLAYHTTTCLLSLSTQSKKTATYSILQNIYTDTFLFMCTYWCENERNS